MWKRYVLKKYETNQYTLRVKDFGKGFDATKRYNTLGLVLMEDISNFFNDGHMMIDFENGTEITVVFQV